MEERVESAVSGSTAVAEEVEDEGGGGKICCFEEMEFEREEVFEEEGALRFVFGFGASCSAVTTSLGGRREVAPC